MAYTSIIVEGGLFPADLLDSIVAGNGNLPGQRAQDFGLPSRRRLTDEVQSAFSDARVYWDAFQRRLVRSNDPRVTITRRDWMVPFLTELLGFDPLPYQQAAAQTGGQSYHVSHRLGEGEAAPPIHIVGSEQDLDRRDGARSPHAMVQELLNRSDALWALVTNGRRLRLLRNSVRMSKPTYVEFDLEGMFEGNLYSEFALLYRLIHASRFPTDRTSAHDSLLEKYYQQGIDEGGRVREKLREGVEAALRVLGTAFLAHPDSADLRRRVEGGQLDASGYYRQLLRLVYRLLFLMVAEERRLVFPPDAADSPMRDIYIRYYSVWQLRERAERYFAGDTYSDLWLGVKETFKLFRDDHGAKQLGLSALDGELFGPGACRDLEGAECANRPLLEAILGLSTFIEDVPGRGRRHASSRLRRRVNYADLNVEEFGSVYEGLLDFHPQITFDPLAFDLVTGSERKQTGSYYTPPELVRELIGSALMPVVEERLKSAGQEREARIKALLSLRICDPAAGSGHFLLAAARRIATELARARCGEEEPPPPEYRQALRDVIRNCIYAVDKNPLAVDLCKVALWIEGHNAGLPLSFLDNHIKCGDSLVGVADLAVLEEGIPDEAYKPVTGDDKVVARDYRDRNRREKKGMIQLPLGGPSELKPVPVSLAEEFQVLGDLAERTPDEVQAKEDLYESLRGRKTDWWKLKVACDLWTAAFFMPLVKDVVSLERVPTTGALRRHLETNSAHPTLVGHTVEISEKHEFFHWPLEFPDVFENGGFDVVLGNPPWDQVQLDAREFFATRLPSIGQARSASARNSAIARLASSDPALYEEFQAESRVIERTQKFIHGSGRFPATSYGRLNSAPLFAELCLNVAGLGLAGVIVPSGIVTDSYNQLFFQSIVSSNRLISSYDYENRAGLFRDVDSRMKFCLLTMSGAAGTAEAADFAFFLHRPEDLHEEERHFRLTENEFALFNSKTRMCPVFRSRREAEITRSIYERLPSLLGDSANGLSDPWGFQGVMMFIMNTDSHLFRTLRQIDTTGTRAGGNIPIESADGNRWLPLWEAKMTDAFNHRAGSIYLNPANARRPAQVRRTDLVDLRNPTYLPSSQFWVQEADYSDRRKPSWTRSYWLTFKRVTSSTNERTVIPCIVPDYPLSYTLWVCLFQSDSVEQMATFTALMSSFAFDYLTRQKTAQPSLPLSCVEQVAVPTPESIAKSQLRFAMPIQQELQSRVLELTYVAGDLQPFARDIGYNGPPFRWDEERRFLIRCELDAAFFHLYGIERDDVDYIMETFPIVKRKDEQAYGAYRTKRVILEIYDEMQRAIDTGQPYHTRLDPPPADPRVAHPNAGATA